MNRQQRRYLQRQGQIGEDGAPAPRRPEQAERRPRPVSQPGAPRRRATPRQFLHEVNVEMRKVVWPSRAETTNYSAVVLLTLVVLTSLIFLLDLLFSHLANFLFNP
jgi:preprotein translocase subunit SecE